jgi:hypothetical protein
MGVVKEVPLVAASADWSWLLHTSCAQLLVCFEKISYFHLEAMVLNGFATLLAKKQAYATLWAR